MLKERGNIKHDVDGGTEIVEPVALVENSTIQNYAGYDPLNTGASESTYPARFGWVQKAIHVSASGKELNMNSGKNAMVKLVKMRQDVAEETAANRMSIELYGDATAYEAINGLQLFLTNDGTGTVGSIDSSVYTNWKSKFVEMTGSDGWSSTTIEGEFAKLHKKCVVGNDKPDLIVSSNDYYIFLEGGQIQNRRYIDTDQANAGFQALQFHGVPVIFDGVSGMPAAHMYFLNTDYIYFRPAAKRNFVPIGDDRYGEEALFALGGKLCRLFGLLPRKILRPARCIGSRATASRTTRTSAWSATSRPRRAIG